MLPVGSMTCQYPREPQYDWRNAQFYNYNMQSTYNQDYSRDYSALLETNYALAQAQINQAQAQAQAQAHAQVHANKVRENENYIQAHTQVTNLRSKELENFNAPQAMMVPNEISNRMKECSLAYHNPEINRTAENIKELDLSNEATTSTSVIENSWEKVPDWKHNANVVNMGNFSGNENFHSQYQAEQKNYWA